MYVGDCVRVMQTLDADSFDACVTDPPYGLEFMGKEWDRLEYGQGRTSKPGIGKRETDWPSNRGWNEARCQNCGHLSHGGSPCGCDRPDFPPADDRWLRMQRWHERWARECYRVLKPGGHLLAFGGTRTSHRLACAIEDAGFEIRDTVQWVYATGFPKGLDVSKAIDKAARGVPQGGADPTSPNHGRFKGGTVKADHATGRGFGAGPGQFMAEPGQKADRDVVAEAERWQGWGTALKPAHEPIVLARKPLIGNVAANVLKHGTGALNIDACRVGYQNQTDMDQARVPQPSLNSPTGNVYGFQTGEGRSGEFFDPSQGRWPANLILSHAPGCKRVGTRRVRGSRIDKPAESTPDDRVAYGGMGAARPARGIGDEEGMETIAQWECAEGCPVAELDRQSGVRKSSGIYDGDGSRRSTDRGATSFEQAEDRHRPNVMYADTGGASRFFYVAKASRSERDAGLNPQCRVCGWEGKQGQAVSRSKEAGANSAAVGKGRTCPECGGEVMPRGRGRNDHPT